MFQEQIGHILTKPETEWSEQIKSYFQMFKELLKEAQNNILLSHSLDMEKQENFDNYLKQIATLNSQPDTKYNSQKEKRGF